MELPWLWIGITACLAGSGCFVAYVAVQSRFEPCERIPWDRTPDREPLAAKALRFFGVIAGGSLLGRDMENIWIGMVLILIGFVPGLIAMLIHNLAAKRRSSQQGSD